MRRILAFVSVFAILVAHAPPAIGQAVAPEPSRTHDVTPADYFTLNTITQFRISPDAAGVVYCEARWDLVEDNRKTDLWYVSLADPQKPRRLTSDRANDRDPRWNERSSVIFFVGNRKRAAETKAPYDGTTQVWQIALNGTSEPKPLTHVEGGIDAYDYADQSLYYTTTTTIATDDPFAKLRQQFAKPEYGDGPRQVSELHRLDLQTWRTELVVAPGRYIREFAVAPTGKRVAMITAKDDSVIASEGESRIDVYDRDTKKLSTPPTDAYRAKAASPHAWLEDLAWSPDGEQFATFAIFDAYPAEVILGKRSENGFETRLMKRPDGVQVNGYGRGVGSPIKWHGNDELQFLAEQQGLSLIGIHTASSAETRIELSSISTPGFEPLPGRETGWVALVAPPDAPMDLAMFPNPLTKLTNLNPQVSTWKIPSVQHTTWKASDGSQVGGVLELPPDYKKGTPLPLVVAIHGGPTTSVKASLEFDPHNGRMYFSTQGYAVLCPNYRGSTGYGDKHLTDLIGRENDVEVNDIIAGVKQLVNDGIVDANRVAVMGWSNGGYLTNCLITRKELPFKLKAASSGAGIVDTVSEWGFNDEPAYPKVFKKGHPWEQPDLYKKTSPTYQLGQVTTPTIIHVGGNDVRCPPGHSRMLHRALKEYVKVPTELVVYPGEPHGLTKASNRRAKMEWDLAWFKEYVK